MSFETLNKSSISDTNFIEEKLNSPLAFSGQLSLGLELSNKLSLDNFIIGQNKAILNFTNSLIHSSKKNSKTDYNPDKCLFLYGSSGAEKPIFCMAFVIKQLIINLVQCILMQKLLTQSK